MTQDEIIEMAKKAGMEIFKSGYRYMDDFDIYMFAKLVAAKAFPDGVDAEWIARRTKYAVEKEREACAEICKKQADVYAAFEQIPTTQSAWAACIDNWDAIKARENT